MYDILMFVLLDEIPIKSHDFHYSQFLSHSQLLFLVIWCLAQTVELSWPRISMGRENLS